jgi:nicotinamide-nucleotide amidase
MPPRPIARILSIGDELLFGRCIDTNAAHLARRLTDVGLSVDRVLTVGDGTAAIAAGLRDLSAGAVLIIATGGLGPTDDDRTRAAVAEVAGVGCAFSDAAWEGVAAWYARVRPGVAIPPANRRQAELPAGATVLVNDRGTAPGFRIALPGGCQVACLPGVPHEMEAMADRLIAELPAIVPGLSAPTIGECAAAGLAESVAQDLLEGLFSEDDPVVGITAHEAGHLTIRAVGSHARVTRRIAEVRRRLHAYLLPAPTLAASLVHVLAARGQTVTAAESCTGGHIAAQLTAIPGASAVLHRSWLCYHAQAKIDLGVDPLCIDGHGVVSEAVAAAMAQAALRRSGADLALASTGIAGPDGGTAATPVGTVWIAAADQRGVATRRLTLVGSRTRIQQRAAAAALQLGWNHLGILGL